MEAEKSLPWGYTAPLVSLLPLKIWSPSPVVELCQSRSWIRAKSKVLSLGGGGNIIIVVVIKSGKGPAGSRWYRPRVPAGHICLLCVWYISTFRCPCWCPHAQRPEDDVTLHLTALRLGLSLNLELGWQPVNPEPSLPPVSHGSTRIAGTCGPRLAFYISAGPQACAASALSHGAIPSSQPRWFSEEGHL